jgi:uncharacterized membrane protein YqjE
VSPDDGAGGGVAGPVRRLAALGLALGRIRLELLAIEVQEEKERIARMLVWAVATTFLGCFALVFVALFVTVALWDSHRLVVLGLFSALFVVLALWGALQLRRLTRAGPTLFQSSIAELRQDSRALDPGRAP